MAKHCIYLGIEKVCRRSKIVLSVYKAQIENMQAFAKYVQMHEQCNRHSCLVHDNTSHKFRHLRDATP